MHLNTSWLGETIVHEKQMTSTQEVAHELAIKGADHGTIVMTDDQTKGRGQANKKWHTTKNKGIALSIILKPSISPKFAPQFTLLTATVLADALASYGIVKPYIKWPNDILIDNKKVAGILTEMKVTKDQIQYVIIGIGMNVNHQYEDLSVDIQESASSLSIETGSDWDIVSLIHHILKVFEQRYTEYIEDGFTNIRKIWESYGFKLGEQIWIHALKNKWPTIFLGIAEDGALIIRTNEGKEKNIYSGEINWFQEE